MLKPLKVLLVLGGITIVGVWLLAWPLSSSEPNVSVTGIVVDASTGRPIPSARVADTQQSRKPDRQAQVTWTDPHGRFVLPTWYEDQAIAASALGYRTQLQTLKTRPFGYKPEVRMDFRLHPGER